MIFRCRRLNILFFLVLVVLFYYGYQSEAVVVAAVAKPEVAVDDNKKQEKNLDKKKVSDTENKRKKDTHHHDKELDVIQLNSRNFGKSISDGNVWLIEFYSPNCAHCVEFAPVYAEIARHYHGQQQQQRTTTTKDNNTRKIKVAKVNGESERALISRFGIYAYPSFFIVDGWSVYQFQQPRMKKYLMDFAEGGYKNTDVIPFYTSPMGPLGLLQGYLISTGHILSDFFQWAQSTFGLSPILVAMILFGTLFLGCFFIIVLLAVTIPPRVKRD